SGHNAGANMAALGGAALAGAGHAPGVSPASLTGGGHPPGAGMTRSAANLGAGQSGISGLSGQHGTGGASGTGGQMDAKTQAEMAGRGLNPDGSHMTQAQLNAMLNGDGP